MTLFQKLQETITTDYRIVFTQFAFNLIVRIERVHEDKTYNKESWLPLSDHFYESKVVDCINFMVKEIKKEISNTTKVK